MMAEKSAEKSAGPQIPVKIPQPHGGALLSGGKPGNKGGTQPASEIRRRLRGTFNNRVKVLRSIADDERIEPKDRLKAIDIMGKYGLGTTKELTVEHVKDRLRLTLDLIRAELPPEEADALIAKMEPIWR